MALAAAEDTFIDLNHLLLNTRIDVFKYVAICFLEEGRR